MDAENPESTTPQGQPASSHPLARLLHVQDLDLAIAQLEHRKIAMPERIELLAVEARLAHLGVRAASAASARDTLLARQAELEAQVDESTQRSINLERRMNAPGIAPRDLQAMETEVRHLATRRIEIEDMELDVMEHLEPIDAELAELSLEQAELELAAATLRSAVTATETVLNAEISTLLSARSLEAGTLEPALRERYERSRARHGGVGAARLVANHCDGCHLELPSMEVERIRHLGPDAIATCESCERILIPPSALEG